jgi:hypothetical protein
MKQAFIILAAVLLQSCAVYHPQRGVFVSSSVQEVPLSVTGTGKTILLSAFSLPEIGLSDQQTNLGFGSGFFYTVSHTYVFDDVDVANLRASLVNSLKARGFIVLEKASDLPVDEAGVVRIDLTFSRYGMLEKRTDSVCMFDAVLKKTTSAGQSVSPIQVEGPVKMTIAASKNESIRLFVAKVAEVIERDI